MGEVLGIYPIQLLKIIHILEVNLEMSIRAMTSAMKTYMNLDHLFKTGTSRPQYDLDILAHLVSLLSNSALDQLSFRGGRDLARQKDEPIGFDGLRVRTDRWCACQL